MLDIAVMVEVDASQFPIVIVTWAGKATMDEVDDFIEGIAQATFRAERELTHMMVLVATDAEFAAAARKYLAEKAKRVPSVNRIVGVVVLTRSAVVRGAMTAMRWLLPNLFNAHGAGDADAVIEKARELGKAKGMGVSLVAAQRFRRACTGSARASA